MPKPQLDAFVWAMMRQARELGQQEERERVLAFLRIYKTPMTDGQWFADQIEQGIHDGGRPFKPLAWTWPEDEDLPPSGDADGSDVNHRP